MLSEIGPQQDDYEDAIKKKWQECVVTFVTLIPMVSQRCEYGDVLCNMVVIDCGVAVIYSPF